MMVSNASSLFFFVICLTAGIQLMTVHSSAVVDMMKRIPSVSKGQESTLTAGDWYRQVLASLPFSLTPLRLQRLFSRVPTAAENLLYLSAAVLHVLRGVDCAPEAV